VRNALRPITRKTLLMLYMQLSPVPGIVMVRSGGLQTLQEFRGALLEKCANALFEVFAEKSVDTQLPNFGVLDR
jgi:hypothetical protein